ncbi:hypothetical protein EUTSA_v10019660mg [Eutrema salsugineum]|uniref:MADS-box domain-containing protein n=1 Tax=Eutrema salsugineum TaxID=72664 RepID=V4KMR5_EUTSA|nr:hypothetical protein EUTSA_v10019660mg [Eutrema salsugineum]
MKELSILCGITSCAIIYNPYDSNLEVWPSNSDVQRVIFDFRTLTRDRQTQKMVDQKTFLRQRITKESEHLKRQGKDNRKQEMTKVMFQCLVGSLAMFHLHIMDLNNLGYMIQQYQKYIDRRMGESSNAAATAAPSSMGIGSLVVATATTVPAAMMHEMNHPEQMSYAAEHMGFSFIDNYHHNHNHHHYYHHQQQQHQQIPSESSTTLTIVSLSSVISVTSPTATNNIWCH